MTDVTSATATFLFTDIEGSTELLKTYRGEYASILEDHHRLLRDAFATYGGREIDNQGDSFFVAFPRARDAVLAAAAAQQGIAAHDWPGDAAVRVRMGIHTGEAEVAADRYVGMSVHRAARISSVGHGGQVLVSPTTAGLLEDEEALPGIRLRDLGEHQLKDISRPVRLHQLDIDGLPASFPPLRSQPRETSKRKRATVAAIGVAAAAATLAVVLWATRDAPPPEIEPNSVVRIDPDTLKPAQVIPVSAAPDLVVAAGAYLWITHYIGTGDNLRNAGDRTLTRVDPSTGEAETVGGGLAPCGIAPDPSGDVWVANCFAEGTDVRSNVVRVDAKTLAFEKTWPIDSFGLETNFRWLTFGGGGLWISGPSGIERIDPQTGKRRLVTPGVDGILTWSEAYGDLWVTFPFPGYVARVDTGTGDPVSFHQGMPEGPAMADVDGDTVWITDSAAPRLVRLNAIGSPDPHSVRLPVTGEGSSPFGVAAGAGAVWATTQEDVWRIDPSTNEVTRIPVPYTPVGVAADDDAVWVTVGTDTPE